MVGGSQGSEGAEVVPEAEGSDVPVDAPGFRVPFSDADHSLLTERAAQFADLLEVVHDVRERSSSHRSLGARETLAALRALEIAGRLMQALSTELLAHYQRVGDSTAHGYRTTAGLLEGEFRISHREARRRTDLSEHLAGRISPVGEAQDPVRPAIAENYADGRISADEASALCRAVDRLPPTVRSLYSDRVEKTLVELAPTVRPKDFPTLCQRIIQHIDPDGRLPQFETDPLAYSVTLTQQRNGDWRLRGLLDCPTGTTLRALLYGRMKDADVPVAVRPHHARSTEATPGASPADGPDESGPCESRPGQGGPGEHHPSQSNPGESGPGEHHPSQSNPGESRSEVGLGDEPGADPGESSECSDPSAAHTGRTIPPIPREAVWEGTPLTVRADATMELDGRTGTFLEDEPSFYRDSRGWPVHLSERVTETVQSLLEQARSSESGTASTVLWEKVLGRTPTEHPPGAAPSPSPPEQHSSPPPPGREPISPAPHAPPCLPSREPTARNPHGNVPDTAADADLRPVSPALSSGVFADGNPHTVAFRDDESSTPGLARHDRLAFLLRSVARERVLHGADHALVVTARPEDLVQADNLISTHAGNPLSLHRLSTWSTAAQMFVHIVDGGGRTIEIRSQGRFATRSQMAVLAARDQGCTFPDCDAPAEWCEAHHIRAFARGGATEIDNLTLVCPFHHRWFERAGWESVFLRGLPAWVPPSSVDARQRPLFHSRFRVALLNLPNELPLDP